MHAKRHILAALPQAQKLTQKSALSAEDNTAASDSACRRHAAQGSRSWKGGYLSVVCVRVAQVTVAHLGSAGQHLSAVCQVVGDVAADWVSQVLGQTLQRGGAGGEGLDGEANEGNLHGHKHVHTAVVSSLPTMALAVPHACQLRFCDRAAAELMHKLSRRLSWPSRLA